MELPVLESAVIAARPGTGRGAFIASLLPALLLAAGCADPAWRARGDQAAWEGRWEDTAAALQAAAIDAPDDRALARELDEARRKAARAHVHAARAALGKGEIVQAVEEMRRASALRSSPRIQQLERWMIATNAGVLAGLARAREAKPTESYRLLSDIAWAAPAYPEILSKLAVARAEAAADGAANGARAEAAGDLEEATRAYADALGIDPGNLAAAEGLPRSRSRLVEQLLAKARSPGTGTVAAAGALLRARELRPGGIDGDTRILGEAAAALRDRARSHAAAGQPGLAWVSATEAAELAPEDADGASLVREMESALAAAARPAVLIRPIQDADGNEVRRDAFATETRETLERLSRAGSLATIVDEAEWTALGAPGATTAGRFTVTLRIEPALIIHQPDQVEHRHATWWVEEECMAPDGSITIDRYPRDYAYDVIHRRVDGAAGAALEIRVAGDPVPVSLIPLPVTISRADTSVWGFADAGVAHDPDDLPSDGVVESLLRNSLLDRLRTALEGEFGWFGRDAYIASARALAAGDRLTAADRAVVAWRARADSGLPFASADLDFVESATGWSPRTRRISPRHLR